jgi:acetoin utilization deacetylase AcuC-like enzyme
MFEKAKHKLKNMQFQGAKSQHHPFAKSAWGFCTLNAIR